MVWCSLPELRSGTDLFSDLFGIGSTLFCGFLFESDYKACLL